MTNRYNDTLVGRVKMFQRQNGFEETGIATPDMQVLLFSEDAKVNEEPLPKPPTHYRRAGAQTQGGSGWKKIVCPCCGGGLRLLRPNRLYLGACRRAHRMKQRQIDDIRRDDRCS